MFLSKPDNNKFSSNCKASVLLFLASFPLPIPSLIAIKYFPSFNLIVNVLSPEISLFVFVLFAIPKAITYLSSDINSIFLPTVASWFNTIFSPNVFVSIFSINSILDFSIFSDKYISIIYLFSFLIAISCIIISFCSNSDIISCLSLIKFPSCSISFSRFFAILPIAFDTSFSCFLTFLLFCSIFFFQINSDLLCAYDIFIVLTICIIFSSNFLLMSLSSKPII